MTDRRIIDRRQRQGSLPAASYLHHLEDAHTFLRYAERALADARREAPDHLSRADIAQVHANCRATLSQTKETRNRTHSRYTPRGQRKGKGKAKNGNHHTEE